MIIKLEDYVPITDDNIKFIKLFSEAVCNFIDYVSDEKLSYLIELFSDMGGLIEFASFVHNYNKLTTYIYVYVEFNVIVGFIMYHIDENICTIGYLAVDEKHRNKKIGSKLLKHVINLNMELDSVEKIGLLVSVNNTNALKL